jgi:hypothetical protein
MVVISQALQQYSQPITQSAHCIGKVTFPEYLYSCIPGFVDVGSSQAVINPGHG